MRFDQNDNRIMGIHRVTEIHDNIVVDLKSIHAGISDDSVISVLQMVHEEKISDFYSILKQMSGGSSNEI